MEFLPEEMVLQISQYLREEDLAACCAVSHAWRDVFNVDIFWRNSCDSALAQYLRSTKCVVKPNFVSPEVADSGLSDVCEWRLNYMRQNHLHNNFRLGRYTTSEMKVRDEKYTRVDRCMFYECDFVVTYGLARSTVGSCWWKIQLWNVASKPIVYSEYVIPVEVTQEIEYLTHQIDVSGNLVVLTQGIVVQVLSITNSHELQFKHAFHFPESDQILEPVPEDLFHEESIGNSNSIVVGQIFVAILWVPNLNEKLHVWNVETGDKLKEEVYEDCTFSLILEKDRSTENKIIFFAKLSGSDSYKVLIYDLTQLVFHPFSVTSNLFPLECLLHKETLAVNTYKNLNIYNISTKQSVLDIPLPELVGLRTCIFKDNIVLNYKKSLKLYTPKTSEIQLYFEHPEFDWMISQGVLCNKFFVIYLGNMTMNVITMFSNNPIFLIEDKNIKVKKPLSFPVSELGPTNTFCSKILNTPKSCNPNTPDTYKYEQVVKLFHFW